MNKLIFRLAKRNKKFPNEIYKAMIKNSNLIVKRASIRLFKEAFHSSKTPSEYRAVLLSSLYHDKPDYRDLIRRTSKLPSDVHDITFQIIEDDKGQKHFGLFGLRANKRTITGSILKKPHRIGLSSDLRKQLHNGYPKALRQKVLTTALEAGKMQFQKAALFIENISRCLFDIAYITKEFVYLNDPLGVYHTSPIESLVTEWEEAHFTGYFAESARIFKKDLEHMMDEFEKYTPYLERMGFNVGPVRNTFTQVHDNLTFYKNKNYNINSQEEIDALYAIHGETGAFVRSLVELGGQIENLNENSPEIYAFRRLEVLPEYVPYRKTRYTITRANDAVDKGLTNELDLIARFLKG